MTVSLFHGDCLEILPTLPANSIDSIVCDPPYGLSFMGKHWDHGVPGVPFWEAALRVAKPGAMLLAFGGTRTFHRLTVAIEDAGWEIRDCLMWVYGSGFPKSHNISAAIDKHLGAEREVIGISNRHGGGAKVFENQGGTGFATNGKPDITAPATPEAKRFAGWGTALKPSFEPIILAMKPLDGTFANNALKWGVGGLNIDASRIPANGESLARPFGYGGISAAQLNAIPKGTVTGEGLQGRWPSNLILDEQAGALLDEMSGERPSSGRHGESGSGERKGMFGIGSTRQETYFDTGGASRYFLRVAHDEDDVPSRIIYQPKASKRDRDEGLEGMEAKLSTNIDKRALQSARCNDCGRLLFDYDTSKCQCSSRSGWTQTNTQRNHHPTVKPTALMRYLVRLVTPKGGTVLDQFLGSGSTGKAAVLEGFNFVGIDNEAEYLELARRRIEHAQTEQAEVQAQPALLEVA